MRKRVLVLIVFILLIIMCTPITLEAATTYQPTWTSIDTHIAAPEWFQDAKFGIYYHWGAFSVPAFGSEWYPRNMYNKGSNEYNNHLSVFGDPYSNWPYHNFINGANNKSGQWTQFAPKLVSDGGKFDPNAWAQLFEDSGAKFAGPVAEHHDGFSMWNSTVNEWNSVTKGPKLDLAAQFATAIRSKGLKFIMAMHHAYNFTGYYQFVPTQSDPSLKKLYGQLDKTSEEQLWYDKLKEIVDQYKPDIIWQDFNLPQISETQRLNFLSYYYNKANDWGKEVVATYKDGFNNKGEVYDYERGGPSDITDPYWLTDDSISSSSWCYTQGIGYYSTSAVLHSLIDRVSKNGNMLLNICPMADGTIPQGQKDILIGMGDWLKKFGESIYSTRAWTTYGEGPTAMGGGSFTGPKAGTNNDIRFTRNKANNTLYAIVLGWPGNNTQLKITTLNSERFNIDTIKSVQLLGATAGTYIDLSYSQNSTAFNVTMPSSQPYNALAYVVKLTFSDTIPALGSGNGSNVRFRNAATSLYIDGMGSTSNGSDVCQWSDSGSNNQQWTIIKSGDYVMIQNRATGLYLDGMGRTSNGSICGQWSNSGSNNQQWTQETVGSNVRFKNRATGLYLDGMGSSSNGSNLCQWGDSNSTNQQWQIQ